MQCLRISQRVKEKRGRRDIIIHSQSNQHDRNKTEAKIVLPSVLCFCSNQHSKVRQMFSSQLRNTEKCLCDDIYYCINFFLTLSSPFPSSVSSKRHTENCFIIILFTKFCTTRSLPYRSLLMLIMNDEMMIMIKSPSTSSASNAIRDLRSCAYTVLHVCR